MTAIELLSARYPLLGSLIRRVRQAYRHIFSIHEIEQQPILQWMLGASILFSFTIFEDWIGWQDITVETAQSGRAVCWPYFQNCYEYFFLHALPYGYSQTIFYMCLYAILITIVWSMWRKHWTLAHALVFLIFVWEFMVNYLLSYRDTAPYSHYHLILTAVLLFAAEKEFFLKLSFVWMYFMASTTKLDSTWVLGTYFTALKSGIAIFPQWSIALLTNLVIFMQIVGAWFLLSKRLIVQRAVLAYFAFFHWFSGVYVLYQYPTVSLPSLLILFGPMYRHTPIPFSKKTIIGWAIIAIVGGFQLLGFIAPGDRRLTLEGNKFGMFMFEANHQCIATVRVHTKKTDPLVAEPGLGQCNGLYCITKVTSHKEGNLLVRETRYESASSWNRCYPYMWWSTLHRRCALNPDVQKVSFRMDHSINGGPFYRIVDEENMCDLTYTTLGPNTWIKSPPEAKIVGYPVQNVYRY